MSQETGGLHVHETNLLSAGIEAVRRTAETYYSLGATLHAQPRQAAGYAVELVSKRPGVDIHLRRHVVPRDPADPAREASEAAVLFGEGPSDLALELTLGQVAKKRRFLSHRDVVDFVVKIPMSTLEFQEGKGVHQADVELTFIAVDEKADTSEPVVVKVPLRVPDTDWPWAKEGVWPHHGTMVARPGAHRFTVTMRDVRSNRLGSTVAAALLE